MQNLLQLTESDVWATRVPYVKCSEDLAASAPVWDSVCRSLVHGGEANCAAVPVSTSAHEDLQLMYSREGVPLCSMGSQCAALLYPGNQGALHVYLMPSLQQQLDEQRPGVFTADDDPHATCLLCIRRDVHGACLAWSAMLPNPARQIHRTSVIAPPFTNLVSVPGGYKKSALAPSVSSTFGNAHIVGVSGELAVKYDPHAKRFYFDQHCIKFGPRSFLGRSTGGRTN